MIEPRLIPVTPEFEKQLTDGWSAPVQVRIIDGEFVVRKVSAFCPDCGCSGAFETDAFGGDAS